MGYFSITEDRTIIGHLNNAKTNIDLLLKRKSDMGKFDYLIGFAQSDLDAAQKLLNVKEEK